MSRPQLALIGLGANLGDGAATLAAALAAVAALPGCRLRAVSGLYRSAPVDAEGPDYWNAVAALDTELEPQDLLRALQAIESAHGRLRPQGQHNAPRTLDLDLLTHGDAHLDTAALTLPHPRMAQRAFVLLPLLELFPDWRLPDGRLAATAARDPGVADQRIARAGDLTAPDQPAMAKDCSRK